MQSKIAIINYREVGGCGEYVIILKNIQKRSHYHKVIKLLENISKKRKSKAKFTIESGNNDKSLLREYILHYLLRENINENIKKISLL